MAPHQAVKELRAKLGWSLQKFATAIEVSMTSVVKYEAGRNPTGRVLVALAQLAQDSGHRDLAKLFMGEFLKEMKLGRPGFWIHDTISNEDPKRNLGVALWVYNHAEKPLFRRVARRLFELTRLATEGDEKAIATLEQLASRKSDE